MKKFFWIFFAMTFAFGLFALLVWPFCKKQFDIDWTI